LKLIGPQDLRFLYQITLRTLITTDRNAMSQNSGPKGNNPT